MSSPATWPTARETAGPRGCWWRTRGAASGGTPRSARDGWASWVTSIVTPVQRDAFLAEATAAGIDWQLHLYGGVGHSFTNRDIDALNLPGFAYDEAADRRSWAAMLNLFEEVLERP